jgi:hypothetical protein
MVVVALVAEEEAVMMASGLAKAGDRRLGAIRTDLER